MIDVIIAIVLILAMFLVGSIILLKEIAEAFNLKGEIKMVGTRQTVFRQTQAEYEKLKNDAHAHRMNISEYLRFLIEKERQDMRKEDEGK